MFEYGLRFVAGGVAVSAFAALATPCALKASRACLALLPRSPSRRFSSRYRKRALSSRRSKAAR